MLLKFGYQFLQNYTKDLAKLLTSDIPYYDLSKN